MGPCAYQLPRGAKVCRTAGRLGYGATTSHDLYLLLIPFSPHIMGVLFITFLLVDTLNSVS